MSHTSGDWTVVTSKDVYPAVVSPGLATICMDVENDADARLIAAAPDLLDALYIALPYVETAESDPLYKKGAIARVLKQLRDVIAKAEGVPANSLSTHRQPQE